LASLVSNGLKGSGDYGVFALGVYNGQLANNPELNNEPHVVSRFSYPFEVKNQILELGIQGYKGNYTIAKNSISTGVNYRQDLTYTDERAALSFVMYPKPFGIQTEYTVGNGPRFNKNSNTIEEMPLNGGYITASYMMHIKEQILIPFLRYQYYDGGKKHERDARSYEVSELEIGAEWQLHKNFELVVNYTISKRRYEDFILSNNLQTGNLLRIQAQVNF
jgi:predicted porin